MMQLEIEEQALTKEKDAASQKRLELITKRIAGIERIISEMRTKWETEKETLQVNSRKTRRT